MEHRVLSDKGEARRSASADKPFASATQDSTMEILSAAVLGSSTHDST